MNTVPPSSAQAEEICGVPPFGAKLSGLAFVRNLHGHAVEGHGVAGVQLLAACFLNVAVDLYQAVLNDLACLRAVLYEVGELEELAEADHVVANKNFFHAL